MSFFLSQNAFTRVAIITAVLLIIYGYAARLLNIYFFWESAFIGWMVAFVAMIGILGGLIKLRKPFKNTTLPQKIVIGLLCLVLLVQAIFLIVVPRTDAYKAVKAFFQNDINFRNEFGEVKDCSIIPVGSMAVSQVGNTTVGEGLLVVIVKGTKKFHRYQVHVVKTADLDHWVVDGVY